MTKNELLKNLERLLNEKGMPKIETLGGAIGRNDNKATIEDAIKCLEATDEEMARRLNVFKKEYPNIYRKIEETGNFFKHSFNRFYVWTLTQREA